MHSCIGNACCGCSNSLAATVGCAWRRTACGALWSALQRTKPSHPHAPSRRAIRPPRCVYALRRLWPPIQTIAFIAGFVSVTSFPLAGLVSRRLQRSSRARLCCGRRCSYLPNHRRSSACVCAESGLTIRCRRDGPDGPRPELKRYTPLDATWDSWIVATGQLLPFPSVRKRPARCRLDLQSHLPLR